METFGRNLGENSIFLYHKDNENNHKFVIIIVDDNSVSYQDIAFSIG